MSASYVDRMLSLFAANTSKTTQAALEESCSCADCHDGADDGGDDDDDDGNASSSSSCSCSCSCGCASDEESSAMEVEPVLAARGRAAWLDQPPVATDKTPTWQSPASSVASYRPLPGPHAFSPPPRINTSATESGTGAEASVHSFKRVVPTPHVLDQSVAEPRGRWTADDVPASSTPKQSRRVVRVARGENASPPLLPPSLPRPVGLDAPPRPDTSQRSEGVVWHDAIAALVDRQRQQRDALDARHQRQQAPPPQPPQPPQPSPPPARVNPFLADLPEAPAPGPDPRFNPYLTAPPVPATQSSGPAQPRVAAKRPKAAAPPATSTERAVAVGHREWLAHKAAILADEKAKAARLQKASEVAAVEAEISKQQWHDTVQRKHDAQRLQALQAALHEEKARHAAAEAQRNTQKQRESEKRQQSEARVSAWHKEDALRRQEAAQRAALAKTQAERAKLEKEAQNERALRAWLASLDARVPAPPFVNPQPWVPLDVGLPADENDRNHDHDHDHDHGITTKSAVLKRHQTPRQRQQVFQQRQRQLQEQRVPGPTSGRADKGRLSSVEFVTGPSPPLLHRIHSLGIRQR